MRTKQMQREYSRHQRKWISNTGYRARDFEPARDWFGSVQRVLIGVAVGFLGLLMVVTIFIK